MKVLKPLPHAVLDYALALLFLAAPTMFDFQSDTAAALARVIGIAYMAVSLITRYPLSLVKWIPFPVHGVLETIMAVAWILMPFVFGFTDDAAARHFFMAAGVALVLVAAITDYRAAERDAHRSERRMGSGDRRRQMMPVANERRMAHVPRRHTALA